MDKTEWGMYTEEGDRAVAEMMRELKDDLTVHALPKVREKLKQKMKEIERVHGEVYDTDVREAITYSLTLWTNELLEFSPHTGIPIGYWGLR